MVMTEGHQERYQACQSLPYCSFLDVEHQLGDELGHSESETLEHYLLERYLLFTERQVVIYRGQVHHTSYYV